MQPQIIVQKYGGSSVRSVEKIGQVADQVVARQRAGHRLVVVVSAMGDATDELLARAKAIAAEPNRRELDMLLSVGERISMSLLALAIHERGQAAVSLTGSQSGIITTASHANARIMEVRPFRIEDELARGRIVIVAGYQGVSYTREITTLGRGGSDTTAVALAAALDAQACEIYSDVDGVYTADPRLIPDAQPIPKLGYEETQELAEAGARVLNAQAVEFAKRAQIALYARETGSDRPGTVVRKHAPAPPSGVRGIAQQPQLGVIQGPLAPERLSGLLAFLSDAQLSARQVHYEAPRFSAVLPLDDVHDPKALEGALSAWLGPGALSTQLGAVSLIGPGITAQPELLSQTIGLLKEAQIPLSSLSTSSFRISLVLPQAEVGRAARLLHDRFGLGGSQAASLL